MNARLLQCGWLVAGSVAAGSLLYGQTPDAESHRRGSAANPPVTLSGEIGSYGELYSINGDVARRPPSTGRLFFRPTLNLFNALSLDFDFLLSTEGSQARQDINQFGVNPTWSWGQAHAGDFTDSYSQYTLGGIRIRGGGFFINPGAFRLGAIGGVTQRAVAGSSSTMAYDRYLYGGRIGVGTAEGGFFDLVFLRARDRASSLSTAAAPAVVDSTNPAASAVEPYTLTPQENLVAGMVSYLNLFGNHVHWNIEASGSMFTRDMTDNGVQPLNVPSWVTNLYRVNVTSSAGVAIRSDLSLNFRNVSLRTGYRFVSPGYNSLGVSSLLNDWQEFSLAPSLRLGTWSVSLNAYRQNDNLLGQKLTTLVRYQWGGNVNFQPADRWAANILGNYLTMSNDAASESTRVSFSSLTLGTTQYVAFPDGAFLQSVNLSYLFQQSGDNSPMHPDATTTTHSANAGLTIPLAEDVSLSPGAGVVVTMMPSQLQQTMASYMLSLQDRAFDNALVTVLSGAMSTGNGTASYRPSLSSTYRLTQSATVGLLLSMMRYAASGSYGINFTEYSASLTFTQRL